MPHAYDITKSHLLAGGDILRHRTARDSHGSRAEHWEHHSSGRHVRSFYPFRADEEQKAALQALLAREVKLTGHIIKGGLLQAELPDGRRIRRQDVDLTEDGINVLFFLSDVLFRDRETAVRLLKDQPVVLNYAPEREPAASPESTPRAGAPRP